MDYVSFLNILTKQLERNIYLGQNHDFSSIFKKFWARSVHSIHRHFYFKPCEYVFFPGHCHCHNMQHRVLVTYCIKRNYPKTSCLKPQNLLCYWFHESEIQKGFNQVVELSISWVWNKDISKDFQNQSAWLRHKNLFLWGFFSWPLVGKSVLHHIYLFVVSLTAITDNQLTFPLSKWLTTTISNSPYLL